MYLLVFYDISEPKRLRQVAKVLLSHGTRVQKSVYEMKIKNKEVKSMQKKISTIIKDKDRIHYYHLCNKDLKKRKADGQASVYFIPDYVIVQ